MKTNNTILLTIYFFFISTKTFSQDIVFQYHKKEFINCEIEYNNGSVKKGFIKNFTLPDLVEFRGFGYSNKKVESKVNLDREKFNFKNFIDSDVEVIYFKDIKSITLQKDDTIKYEKIKLKSFNTNNELVDINIEIMAPLIKKNKINLYGLKLYGNMPVEKTFISVLAYIKKPEDEFALVPFDFNNFQLMNQDNQSELFIRSFEEIGKNCPEYLNYLKEQRKILFSQEIKETMKIEFYQFLKEVSEVKNYEKDKKLQKEKEDNLKVKFYLKMFYKFIEEYSLICK